MLVRVTTVVNVANYNISHEIIDLLDEKMHVMKNKCIFPFCILSHLSKNIVWGIFCISKARIYFILRCPGMVVY